MELLEDRIDRAEKLVRSLKKQTAPTVPQYDLQGGAPVIKYVCKSLVGDAYAGINGSRAEASVFPNTYSDVWVTARIWMSSKFVSAFTQSVGTWPDGDPSNVSFLAILGGSDDGLALIDPSAAGGGGSWLGNDDISSTNPERGSSPIPDPGNWHLYELHTVQSGTSDFFIDGTTVWSGSLDSGGSSSGTSGIWIGALSFTPYDGESGPGNSNLSGGYILYDYVKLGTTRGASDIFSDDFSSGDMSNWSLHPASFAPFVILDPT